jgi:butyrate kinase
MSLYAACAVCGRGGLLDEWLGGGYTGRSAIMTTDSTRTLRRSRHEGRT